MPAAQALQVFYGTIPLILVLAGIFFREQLLLKDILKRFDGLEQCMGRLEEKIGKVIERLTVLETRSGVVYHG